MVGKAWLIDCVGLIKGYYWDCKPGGKQVGYHAATDVSADGMYNKATCKGDISTIPEIPGICVQMAGHIGIYIGNGQVIEATRGIFGDGVVQTELTDRKWLHWLQCPNVIYEDVIKVPEEVPNVPEDWKVKIMEEAKKEGLVMGDHQPDEPATKWFVLAVCLNLLKAVRKGGK